MARLTCPLIIAAALSIATPARSEEQKVEPEPVARLQWNPAWTRFRPVEYVVTPIVGAAAIYELLFMPEADKPRWNSPILFDAPVRDALHSDNESTTKTARQLGDVVTLVPIAYVMLVDSLLVPGIAGSGDLAWQMTAMNLEAFATSGFIVGSLFAITRRARPSYDECTDGKSNDPLCNTNKFDSFPGGHTGAAFTAAGLECAHHANVPLYGGGAGDTLACVGSIALASTATVLRVVGDRHWASDVLVGSVIGFFSGFGLPSLLHYRKRPVTEVYASSNLKVGVALGTPATLLGTGLYGMF
jgi:membrane-associated phospholipid phosphatase